MGLFLIMFIGIGQFHHPVADIFIDGSTNPIYQQKKSTNLKKAQLDEFQIFVGVLFNVFAYKSIRADLLLFCLIKTRMHDQLTYDH